MRPLTITGLAVVLLSSPSLGAAPEPATGADATSAISEVAQAGAPLYQPTSEMLFVPLLTPCRAFKISLSAPKVLNIGGTKGFRPQGGRRVGCGVPITASAVAITLTAWGAAAPGTAVAWAKGSAKPDVVTASFLRKFSSTTAATVVLEGGQIKLSASVPAKFRGDVTGYYVRPMAGMISPSGLPYSGTSRITGGARTSSGIYEVTFDRDIRYCSATATVYATGYYASASTFYDSTRPDTVRVWIFDATGAAKDQYFYISVRC
jgi:hypothetical protein